MATAVSGDGGTMAIGAPGEASRSNFVTANPSDDSAPDTGAVYVFERTQQGCHCQDIGNG